MGCFLIIMIVILSACSSSKKEVEDREVKSESTGTVRDGTLKNGKRFPFKGTNFKYFSRVSYSVLDRAWVHSSVHQATLDAYEAMQEACPERTFLLMECSHKNGGPMPPHKTHQNGTSIDFGSPLQEDGKASDYGNGQGLAHYAMEFSKDGVLTTNKKVSIDFEAMARHILALDKAAREQGMYIKKVILKINLKDDFFDTPSGRKVKRKKIYFAKSLPKQVDDMHDDHYHVDFGFL